MDRHREMVEWMDKCMEGHRDGWTDRQKDERVEGQRGQLEGLMNGLIDVMNKWMNRQIDGWIYILILPSPVEHFIICNLDA